MALTLVGGLLEESGAAEPRAMARSSGGAVTVAAMAGGGHGGCGGGHGGRHGSVGISGGGHVLLTAALVVAMVLHGRHGGGYGHGGAYYGGHAYHGVMATVGGMVIMVSRRATRVRPRQRA